MLASDRAEFDIQLASLCAGFNVPVSDRGPAYWRGLGKMELRTFVRVIEFALGEHGPEKIPTTRQCWSIAKAARPTYQPPAPPAGKQWTGDRYDMEGNLRLMALVRAGGTRYAPDASYDSNTHQSTPGPLTHAYTAILIQWRNSWAEDCRVELNPTPTTRSAAWADCMRIAHDQIASYQAPAPKGMTVPASVRPGAGNREGSPQARHVHP